MTQGQCETQPGEACKISQTSGGKNQRWPTSGKKPKRARGDEQETGVSTNNTKKLTARRQGKGRPFKTQKKTGGSKGGGHQAKTPGTH